MHLKIHFCTYLINKNLNLYCAHTCKYHNYFCYFQKVTFNDVDTLAENELGSRRGRHNKTNRNEGSTRDGRRGQHDI